MSSSVVGPVSESGVIQLGDGSTDSSIQIPAIETNELVGYERGKLMPLTSLSNKFLGEIEAYDLIKKIAGYRVYCTTTDTIAPHSLSDCGSNCGHRLVLYSKNDSAHLHSDSGLSALQMSPTMIFPAKLIFIEC